MTSLDIRSHTGPISLTTPNLETLNLDLGDIEVEICEAKNLRTFNSRNLLEVEEHVRKILITMPLPLPSQLEDLSFIGYHDKKLFGYLLRNNSTTLRSVGVDADDDFITEFCLPDVLPQLRVLRLGRLPFTKLGVGRVQLWLEASPVLVKIKLSFNPWYKLWVADAFEHVQGGFECFEEVMRLESLLPTVEFDYPGK